MSLKRIYRLRVFTRPRPNAALEIPRYSFSQKEISKSFNTSAQSFFQLSRSRSLRYDPIEAERAKPLLTLSQISYVATHRISKFIYIISIVGAGIFYLQHLETTPVSGRRRFMYFTDADAEEEYKLIYADTMQKWRHSILPPWDWRTQKVNRVMKRLIVASGLEHLDWEFLFLLTRFTAFNAFVIPGGKVFVMSGTLPIAGTDSELASVLSHEMAHGIASHQAERMSRSKMVVWPLRIVLILFFHISITGILGNLLLEFGLNRPALRTQEREADYIGLILMARACYDPKAAVVLWKRVEELEAAQGMHAIAWLSTHPTSSSRADLVKKWLPKAEAVRKEANCSRYSDLFRHAVPSYAYPRFMKYNDA